MDVLGPGKHGVRDMEERPGPGRRHATPPPDAATDPANPASRPTRTARSPATANRPGSIPQSDSADTALTIPRGILYSGRIESCERLTVEGAVETELVDCRVLTVAGDGVFRGAAHVETADISGALEGSLRVRGTLTVRASARILSDSVSYAELEIERGGIVAGAIRLLPEDAERATPADTAQPAAGAL